MATSGDGVPDRPARRREALVFGGSGQIGTPLIGLLRAAGWHVVAVSRQPQPDGDRLRWVRGDLAQPAGLPDAVDAIFSCGPLDAFAGWYQNARIQAPRVVAFGSTSLAVKRKSSDAAERNLAERLQRGESNVLSAAAARGGAATMLRPTLVYGAGRDQTLTRVVTMARRWGCFVLPAGACGLRQPVHVDDLALAAMQACDAASAAGQSYALPGGETLPYRDMIQRAIATQQPPLRLVEVPALVFKIALLGARSLGQANGFGHAAVARLREDLVFDATPAHQDLGYAPRPFRPTAAMFAGRNQNASLNA